MRTLKAIHGAGVLHRDIRSWNLMVDSHGQTSIVDFDRGSFRASETDYVDEIKRLKLFLSGEYIDQKCIIGKDDLQQTHIWLVSYIPPPHLFTVQKISISN